MTTRAIFLDRDGVLNHPVVRDGKSYPPARVEDLEIYDGLREPLQRLKDRGFALIVVTNQPDVARGTTPQATVEGINVAIAQEIPAIDKFIVCYHDNTDGCNCRKPKPGMLLAGAAEFDIDLRQSYMIGDRKGDVDAGRAAGSKTIFVDRGYHEAAPTNYDHKVSSTKEALQIIESESDHEKS